MLHILWPMLAVVGANTLYNTSAKSTPASIDPFASLGVTYLVAAVSSFALFFLTNAERNLGGEFAKLNWASFALGIAVVGLEFGFLNVYRAGWKISTAQLTASVGLSVVLLVLGHFVYHETVTVKQAIGMLVCALGLLLIAD